MSKVLKIAGEVIVGAALIAVTAGAAAGLIGGLSLTAAVGIGAAAVGSIGIGLGTVLAIGAGLTLAGGLLAKKPQTSPSQIDRTKVSLILDAPRKIVFGHTALGTDLRYQLFYGAEQEYVSQVLVVASHWCESIDQVWLNDQIGWDATTGTASAFAGYFFVVGFAQANAASSYNVGQAGLWAANAVFTGCATLHLQYRVLGLNDKAGGPFSSSIPTRVTVRGKAARVYDPRLDDTAGGAGAQRVADQTTWAFAPGGVENGRNPALCLLFYLLGWRIHNPTTGVWKLAVGLGVPVDRIDLDSFITAANQCDEQVSLAAGGTEPRYRCDGMFSEADDPGTVITALESAMNAKLRDSAGRFSLQVFHDDLAVPILDFTDDDVLDDFTWDAGAALNELKNVIRGRYTDPSDASLYQLVDYPPVSLPSLDEIDRIETFDLALVQSPSQAQRLAKQRLQRYQYPGTFAANFKARGWAVKDGDVVRLTFAALGFQQKLFRVTKATVQVTGVVPLVLAEENAAIYLWDGEEAPAVVAAAPTVFDPTKLPVVQAIGGAVSATLQQAIATSFPVGLTITAAPDGTITISDHTRRYTDGHADVAVTGATIASGLSAGAFRAIYYDDPNRSGGAVAYALDPDDIDARASPGHPARHYLGYIVVPTAGSPPADGGGATPPGGRCVTVDTPVMMADGSTRPAGQLVVGDGLMTRHEERVGGIAGGWGIYPVEAIEIADSDDVWEATIGGKALRATSDHLVYTGTWTKISDAPGATKVAGTFSIVKLTVTDAHTYVSNGILSHNLKPTDPDA